MTEAQFQEYLTAVRQQTVRPQVRQPQLEQVRLRVSQVAQRLKAEFGAQRVILFGSTAHQTWFNDESDVDIAVEGIPPDQFWAAWDVAESLLPQRAVDLVDLVTASAALRRAIERDGIEL